MNRYAHVYFRDEKLFVTAILRTTAGMTPNGLPATVCSISDPPDLIGKYILESLAGSRSNVVPLEADSEMERALEISHMISWDIFFQEWNLISVEGAVSGVFMYTFTRDNSCFIRNEGDRVETSVALPGDVGKVILGLIKKQEPAL